MSKRFDLDAAFDAQFGPAATPTDVQLPVKAKQRFDLDAAFDARFGPKERPLDPTGMVEAFEGLKPTIYGGREPIPLWKNDPSLPKAAVTDVPGIAGRGLVRAELGAAKGVLGTLDAMLSKANPDRTLGFGAPFVPQPTAQQKQKMAEDTREAMAPVREARRRIISAQDRFDTQYSGGLAWGTRVVVEAIPYMANAMAAGAVAGPMGAATVGFVIEGDNAYDEAIASGATEAQANTERVIVGSINAGIEALQIGRLLKFSKSGKHSLKAFIKLAREKGIKAAGGELKGFTAGVLRLSIENAIEEFTQEGVSMGTPALLRGEHPEKADGSPDYWAIANRLGEAAAGGALAGPILGVGGQAIAGGPTAQVVDNSITTTPVVDTETAIGETQTQFAATQVDRVDAAPEGPVTVRQKQVKSQMDQGLSYEDATTVIDTTDTTGRTTADITENADTQAALTRVQNSIEASEQAPAPVIAGKAAAPRFTAPGLSKLITSKRLLMRRIGAEVITDKLTIAKEKLEVLKSDLVRETNQVLKGLRKQASLGDRVSSRILNKNTKPVQQMVELLDTHERLPENIALELSPETVEAFNKLRDTTVWLRERTNVAREKAGLQPIGDIKGYLPHWTNSMADEVINGTLPYSTGFLGRLMKGVSKSKLNKTALHRQVQQKIQKHMENDLGRLMRGLISYDLHDMLMANPQAAVWEELYALREAGAIPEVVYNEISDYINYDILGRQTKYDRIFNNAAVIKTTTELVNKVLRPLNREITNPAMSYFGGARRMMHAAFLPFRLRPATRNLGQRLLNLSFFRGRDLLRAQMGKQDTIADPKTGEQRKVLDVVRDTDWYKLTKPEDTLDDRTIISTLTKVGMVPFKLAHVGNRYLSNVDVSALTAYYDWKHRFEQSHDTSSAHYKNIVKHSEKTRIPIDQLQTQKEDMMDDIRDGVQMTQWEYMSHSMPTIFRGQTNRALGAYQSWWMNYFTSMVGEGFHRLTTGRTRVRGNRTGGRLLTPYARTRVIKGMGGVYGMAKVAKQTMGIAMIGALFLPDPSSGLPPLLSLASSMAQLLLGFDEPEKKKQAWKDIKKFGARIMPFNAAVRDAAKVGDTWTLKDYVFYTNNEEWKQLWVPAKPKKKKRKGKF